jgi:hypothetical protein
MSRLELIGSDVKDLVAICLEKVDPNATMEHVEAELATRLFMYEQSPGFRTDSLFQSLYPTTFGVVYYERAITQESQTK